MEEIYSRIHEDVDVVLTNYKGSTLISCYTLDDEADSTEKLAVRKLIRSLNHEWLLLYPPLVLAILANSCDAI